MKRVVSHRWLARLRRSRLAEWQAVALVLTFGLLLWTLAYQVPYTLHLAVGGDMQTRQRNHDAPFLRGFHASEPDSSATWRWWTLEPGYTYRWTTGAASIAVPGIGGGRWAVALLADSGRPQGLPAASVWQAGTTPPLAVDIPATPRRYHLVGQASPDGTLTLDFATQPYQSPDDPRELGFALRSVIIEPAGGGLRLPALPVLGSLLTVLLLSYTLARWLVLPLRPALLLLLAGGLLAAGLLASHRMALTLLLPALTGLLVGCWLLALLVRAAAFKRWQPAWGAVLALVLLAFVLRAGGMLHPHAIFSDHRLNANNLLEVGLGTLYFTEGLPAEAGGGQAPYPPGVYLLLAPALALTPPGALPTGAITIESRVLVVQLGVALLDSLLIGLLWLLLRRAGSGKAAALCGAALYLAPPPLLASFSIGEYANLGGQALALPVLALLALGGKRDTGSTTLLFGLLVGMALLGHLGVTISLVGVLAAAWVLTLAARLLRQPAPLLPLAALTGGGTLGALAAALLYYSAPPFQAIFAARLVGSTAENSPPAAPLETLGALVGGLFAPGSALFPLLLLVGLVGVALLWQQRHSPTRRPLLALLLAWWGGTLLSLGLLLVAQQGVRWQHFLYPALCLGGGVTLAALWRRGRSGQVVALAGLLAIVAYGVERWISQIASYLH